MGKVVNLNCVTRLDLPADRILEEAIGKLDKAIVIGYDKAGELYIASSVADGSDILWFLERAKKKLFEVTLD
jgi:hypothetical protein